jgi:hypothetical protein
MWRFYYFRSDDERLYLSCSRNGIYWDEGKRVADFALRDPCVVRRGDNYYLVASNGWDSNSIVYSTSPDGINWSQPLWATAGRRKTSHKLKGRKFERIEDLLRPGDIFPLSDPGFSAIDPFIDDNGILFFKREGSLCKTGILDIKGHRYTGVLREGPFVVYHRDQQYLYCDPYGIPCYQYELYIDGVKCKEAIFPTKCRHGSIIK